MHSSRNGEDIYFSYTPEGVPMALAYEGTSYVYVTNLQGDVLHIVDTTGTVIGGYTYDAWGGQVGAGTATICQLNPLRYRGYVYDTETGLYYVSSRYYDPEIGRWINADIYTATGQGFVGNNMFIYCLNNPFCRVDIQGYISVEAASRLIQINAEAIKMAGEEFGVDPVVIAGCIYAEQILNVDWKDTLTDLPLSFLDTSIGIGQVKVSTAIKLQKLGYIQRKPKIRYISVGIPVYSTISSELTDNNTNIRYVAAYLRAWQDVWRVKRDISKMPGILGTLYNLGEMQDFQIINRKQIHLDYLLRRTIRN